MFKPLRKIALAIVVTMCVSFISVQGAWCGESTTGSTEFSDISASQYKEAINLLEDLGIAEGTGSSKFNPKGIVSKAEAAAFIQRAFKLSEVTPMVYTANPDLEKKTVYKSGLETINEAYTVPSAKDITTSWAYTLIEGILNARID